jgi:hypothetical protein
MARRPTLFTQRDLTKALKAALKAGIKPCRAKIDQNGKIVLDFETGGPASSDPPTAFDRWEAERNARKA